MKPTSAPHALVAASAADALPSAGPSSAVQPRWLLWLRCGAACVLALLLWVYVRQGFSWRRFAPCFLLPDVLLAAYLLCTACRAALFCNLAHNVVGAALPGKAGMAWVVPVCVQVSLIWLAHVCFDRMLGLGLKDARGFRFIHLGVIGDKSGSAQKPKGAQCMKARHMQQGVKHGGCA